MQSLIRLPHTFFLFWGGIEDQLSHDCYDPKAVVVSETVMKTAFIYSVLLSESGILSIYMYT